MTALLLAALLLWNPSTQPLVELAFTSPPDIHADMNGWPRDQYLPVTTCASYRCEAVDSSGIRFPVQVWADTMGGIKHPRAPGLPDSVFVVGPAPGETFSYRLAAVDSAGNPAKWSNAVAVRNVAGLAIGEWNPVPLDSCCVLVLPQRRYPPAWSPDRPIGPLTISRGFASFVLGVADSSGVAILTFSEDARRVQPTVCSWPWQRLKGWPIGGKWEPCP